jgi:hypothetical protein
MYQDNPIPASASGNYFEPISRRPSREAKFPSMLLRGISGSCTVNTALLADLFGFCIGRLLSAECFLASFKGLTPSY